MGEEREIGASVLAGARPVVIALKYPIVAKYVVADM